MTRSRRAAVLLEVLAALTIVSVVGAAIGASLSQARHSLHRSQRATDEVTIASELLEVVAMWPVADLDRHLGSRVEGKMVLRLSRSARALYEATVWDSTGTRMLLTTTIFRRPR